MKYIETKQDKARVKFDLDNHQLMLILKNIKKCKFNVGDVLIKQKAVNATINSPHGSGIVVVESEWQTCMVSNANKAPIKYLYAFENELGIGYLKRLKPDGSGPDDKAICIVNYDPNKIRFTLDPEYVDHMLIGEGEFQYNATYLEKKNFRREAVEKNNSLKLTKKSDIRKWFNNLKVGDTIWFCSNMSNTDDSECKVVAIINISPDEDKYIEITTPFSGGRSYLYSLNHMEKYGNIFTQKPYSLTDPLCDHQK